MWRWDLTGGSMERVVVVTSDATCVARGAMACKRRKVNAKKVLFLCTRAVCTMRRD